MIEVLVTKSILSASISSDVFRFYENMTELIEIESGLVENESINIALQMKNLKTLFTGSIYNKLN